VKKLHYIFVCALAVSIAGACIPVRAQSGNPKTMVTRADALYEQREYEQAAGYYTRLSQQFPDNVVYQFRAGVCAIYTGDPALALKNIKGAYEKDPTIPDVNFFLGRAYLLNGMYDDALIQFNLQLAKEPDEVQRLRLDQYVINCGAAKDLSAKPTNNKVENAGRPINSPGDEYAPVMIKGDSVMYFTYKGPNSKGGKNYTFGRNDSAGVFYEDVFMTSKTSTGWFYPGSVSDNINSESHDATSTISPDGTQLFIYKSSPATGGDIYVSNKKGNDWSAPVKIPGDVNRADSWEGSVAITPDGRTMYFVSDRTGGFGGKDLYRAQLLGDSAWGNVQNLGANINTLQDDDGPYLTDNGYKMYFASRGHNSMGGYDIFWSELGPDGSSWQLAQNMGVPVNSTADDIYYQPLKDGSSAVFSSNRDGGNGLMDIYFASPGVAAQELVTVHGTVTLDDQPINAVITVTYTNKEGVQGDYGTSSENGKYTINLPAGDNYKIYYLVNEMDEYSKTLDATQVGTYQDNEINVQFYSDAYKLAHPEKFGKMNPSDSAKVTQTMASQVMIDKDIKMKNDSSKNWAGDDENTPVDPGFYIVIGAFKNKENAKRMEEKVRAQNKWDKVQRVYNKNNGFMYVTIAHPGSQSESVAVVRQARKEYPDAWIQFLK
jgi:hypothetical protein